MYLKISFIFPLYRTWLNCSNYRLFLVFFKLLLC